MMCNNLGSTLFFFFKTFEVGTAKDISWWWIIVLLAIEFFSNYVELRREREE